MKQNTSQQFETIIKECKEVFINKNKDYGAAWRILRASSLTDQIFIKANRIRSIQTKGITKVDEGVRPEFIGIVNYSVMAIIQLVLGHSDHDDLNPEKAESLFDKHIHEAKDLMNNKNHDYDEAWRSMRISSITDIILMKLFRVKQIEDNQGKTIVSEGLEANYQDIINYGIFALILLSEQEDNNSN
ncbi:MAG: DUF1599 domain-containing protein [Bacteroidales bacterium]